ncbi:MAG: segregation/condensation protein A [Rhodospirillales bacterium]|nr:segregation/condensation protein A [Rhodospirillales bacterium]
MLSVAGFEGPLDWLLEMVRARKIDLTKLSIVALIGSFADALEAALATTDRRPAQLGRMATWLVMAATLTEMRSRLLLPADTPEAHAATAEAEALRCLLVDRARMGAAASWLERKTQLGRDVFARGLPAASTPGRGGDPGRVGDITDLLRACLVALLVPEQQAAALRPRPPPLWRASDAIPHMRQRLAALPAGGPLAAFLPIIAGQESDRDVRCRAAVASTLLAGLELARDGVLALEQEVAWTPIGVRHHDAGAGEREAPA